MFQMTNWTPRPPTLPNHLSSKSRQTFKNCSRTTKTCTATEPPSRTKSYTSTEPLPNTEKVFTLLRPIHSLQGHLCQAQLSTDQPPSQAPPLLQPQSTQRPWVISSKSSHRHLFSRILRDLCESNPELYLCFQRFTFHLPEHLSVKTKKRKTSEKIRFNVNPLSILQQTIKIEFYFSSKLKPNFFQLVS